MSDFSLDINNQALKNLEITGTISFKNSKGETKSATKKVYVENIDLSICTSLTDNDLTSIISNLLNIKKSNIKLDFDKGTIYVPSTLNVSSANITAALNKGYDIIKK